MTWELLRELAALTLAGITGALIAHDRAYRRFRREFYPKLLAWEKELTDARWAIENGNSMEESPLTPKELARLANEMRDAL